MRFAWPRTERPIWRQAVETAADSIGTVESDPLRRLLSPDFTDTLWEYEGSRVEPLVPGNLHEKQLEALEADARHRFLFWANQAGKSSFGCIDDVLLALGRHPVWSERHPPPVTIWVSALSWELWEKILLPELLTWIPESRIIDAPPPHQQSTKRDIVVLADNGSRSRITGKSAEQGAEKYQSARVDRIHFDEEHPSTIWEEAMPRLVRHGGHTLTTATPLKGLTWLYHRIYQPWKRGQRPDIWCSHAGLADNPAIDDEEVDRLKREYEHAPHVLKARVYGLFARPTGIALRVDPNRDFETWSDAEAMRQMIREQGWNQFAGIDFGYWRFAFVHLAADRAGRAHVVGEVFSQRETLSTRAKKIHEQLERFGAPRSTSIWGDAANPTDILEINGALKLIGSPYRVRAVESENKLRSASVTRINNLLGRNALLFRRDLAQYQNWRLGMNASSEGQPMMGSRLLWEMDNWRYPKPTEVRGEEQAQKEDPDDNTADGADCIAALRYAVMSWWKAASFEPPPKQRSAWDPDVLEHEAREGRRVRSKPPLRSDDLNPLLIERL